MEDTLISYLSLHSTCGKRLLWLEDSDMDQIWPHTNTKLAKGRVQRLPRKILRSLGAHQNTF